MKFFSSLCVACYASMALTSAAPHRYGNNKEGECEEEREGSSPNTSSLQQANAPLAAVPSASLPSPFGAVTTPSTTSTAGADANSSAIGTLLVDMGNGITATVTLTLDATPSSFEAQGLSTRLKRSSRTPVAAVSSSITTQTANVTSSAAPETASSSSATSVIAEPPVSTGKVEFGGVNIAGFDFHCKTDGTCRLHEVLDVVRNGNAIQQMEHFTNDDGLNTFRLPVSWHYLVNNRLGGPLDENNFGAYDKLVRGCIDSGAKLCIIDMHNYARWNGRIIGQGGPTNDQYASLWSQLAARYAHVPNIAFDIMNEPHDLDISTWAESVQAAVSAIRETGATNQMILLPGTDYASAKTFVSSGSAQALSLVKNPDGTVDNLVYNVHRYLDSDRSGTHAECVTNNIDEAFAPLARYLKENRRTAMLTETGGGPNEESCLQFLCEQMDFINKNSDVFLGVVTWAAGGFPTDYVITETPNRNGDVLVDQPLVKQCVVNRIGRPQ